MSNDDLWCSFELGSAARDIEHGITNHIGNNIMQTHHSSIDVQNPLGVGECQENEATKASSTALANTSNNMKNPMDLLAIAAERITQQMMATSTANIMTGTSTVVSPHSNQYNGNYNTNNGASYSPRRESPNAVNMFPPSPKKTGVEIQNHVSTNQQRINQHTDRVDNNMMPSQNSAVQPSSTNNAHVNRRDLVEKIIANCSFGTLPTQQQLGLESNGVEMQHHSSTKQHTINVSSSFGTLPPRQQLGLESNAKLISPNGSIFQTVELIHCGKPSNQASTLPPQRQLGRGSNATLVNKNTDSHSRMSRIIQTVELKRDGEPLKQATYKGRKVGRIRRYNEQTMKYGNWEDLHVSNDSSMSNSGSIHINLNRGGKVSLHTNMLRDNIRQTLSTAMHNCKLYRQYTRSQVFHEPRFHVLLSSKAAHYDSGYMYHGIKMKALPISLVPEVDSIAGELAQYYNLPNNQWDIGVDMIVYKDGEDSIGWHADDTQGESVVLCVVIDAPGDPRPVHIRPNKRSKPLENGDEEIQLHVGEGDAYDMDGIMQAGYEHCLPKRRDDKSHRFVLLFRHGNEAAVPIDSGRAITELAKPTQIDEMCKEGNNLLPLLSKLRVKRPLVEFGHPQGVKEGSCYNRRYLYSTYAHRADQRGVNGNINLGCDSIVVSRQSPDCREEDGLSWLRYTSNRRQGGGALCLSHSKGHPIRVFRSSNLLSEYAPPEFNSGQTSYRYDGLYIVTTVWDAAGNLMAGDNVREIPVAQLGVEGDQYTFHLVRIPTLESSPIETSGEVYNSMSLDELWNKIELSLGRCPAAPFVQPRPTNYGTMPRIRNKVVIGNGDKHVGAHSRDCISLPQLKTTPPLERASLKVNPPNLNDFSTKSGIGMRDSHLWNRSQDRLEYAATHPVHNSMHGGSVRGIPPQSQPPLVSVSRAHPPNYPSRNNPIQPDHIMVQGKLFLLPTYSPTHQSGNREALAALYQSSRRSRTNNSQTLEKEVDQHQLEKECDFTDSNSIMKCFKYCKDKGRLRPELSEIAELGSTEEKVLFLRNWRDMTSEQQEQHKKEKRREASAQKKAAKAEERRRRKQLAEEQRMAIKAEKVDKKRKLKELADAQKISITYKARREMKTFVLDSIDVIFAKEKRKINKIKTKKQSLKKIIKRKSPKLKPKPKPSKLKKTQNYFVRKVKASQLTAKKDARTLRKTKRQQKSTQIVNITLRRPACGQCVACLREDCGKCIYPKKKYGGPNTLRQKCIESRCVSMGASSKATTAKKPSIKPNRSNLSSRQSIAKQPSNKPSRSKASRRVPASEPVKVADPPRKMAIRFTTDKKEGIQSLANPLVASCRVDRRKFKDVQITVKWALPGNSYSISHARKPGSASRKRGIHEVEPMEKDAEGGNRRKSPRLSTEIKPLSFLLRPRLESSNNSQENSKCTKSSELLVESNDIPARRRKSPRLESSSDNITENNEKVYQGPRHSSINVPMVGMRVSVRFDNNKRYNGQIVQVSKQKLRTKKKKTASYNISIQYDDGDVEFAKYPDHDISLLSME